ncbi:hypothetical protein [Pedobacter nyackensis]|uniref:hypothetical protein n=1 Tax=Pedobacter nyackensis TaxID=475255 RepID=UPI00292EABD2|nr:hypothetical protein [Pedobacter nyackensis]
MIRKVNRMRKIKGVAKLLELRKLVLKEGERLLKEHNKQQKRKNKEDGGMSCGMISKDQ